MARQNFNVNTSDKKIEVFSSFEGGMVTQAHPEKLRDDQAILVENADIVAGGVIENRGAYTLISANGDTILGETQGRFRYENSATGGQDIVVLNGRLYNVVGNTYTPIVISGLTPFQTTRRVEAVQLRDKLYIATGSGLVVYDGTTAALTVAHAPTGLEVLDIGTNGYAVTPETYLSDAVAVGTAILGVMPSILYGLINVPITFTSFIQKPAPDIVEYQFETKRSIDPASSYVVEQVWSTNKAFTKTFATKENYSLRVSLRKQGNATVLSQYVIPNYKVESVPEENPPPSINFEDMSKCNRVFVHYDRLWLYGDTGNPDFLYCSHLNKFNYFPRSNLHKITDPMRGALNKVIQYKDFLVCFTEGSIQVIVGRNPSEFEKQPVHNSLGTSKPYSVQLLRNSVVFVGNDNGIHVLKSFNYASSDKLNVERIDQNNRDLLSGELRTSDMVLSAIHDNQYYLYIENETTSHIYRLYYDLGVWVRDVLPMKLSTLDVYKNVVAATSKYNGSIFNRVKGVFKDNWADQFVMRIISKDYDFGVPHHRKRLKQYQLIVKLFLATTVNINIYADDNLLSTTPIIYDYNQLSDTQKLKVMTSGRFRTVRTDISILVKEPIQLIGFGFVFKENTPK